MEVEDDVHSALEMMCAPEFDHRDDEIAEVISTAGLLLDESFGNFHLFFEELAGGLAIAERALQIAQPFIGDREIAEVIGATGLLLDEALGNFHLFFEELAGGFAVAERPLQIAQLDVYDGDAAK